MSANKYRFHLLVLPEDDANREIAVQCFLHPAIRQRAYQVLHVARGWRRVMECFEDECIDDLNMNPHRHLLLLIDFDNDPNRLETVKQKVPAHLESRVFVLGVRSEPEALKTEFGSYESIGELLAAGCFDPMEPIWQHPLLNHNVEERRRLHEKICPDLVDENWLDRVISV